MTFPWKRLKYHDLSETLKTQSPWWLAIGGTVLWFHPLAFWAILGKFLTFSLGTTILLLQVRFKQTNILSPSIYLGSAKKVRWTFSRPYQRGNLLTVSPILPFRSEIPQHKFRNLSLLGKIPPFKPVTLNFMCRLFPKNTLKTLHMNQAKTKRRSYKSKVLALFSSPYLSLLGFFLVSLWSSVSLFHQQSLLIIGLPLQILFFIAASSLLLQEKIRTQVIRISMRVSVPLCLYFIAQRFQFDFWEWSNAETNPIGSTLINRNYLVFFLLLLLPYGFWQWRTQIQVRKETSVILVLQISSLLMSNSRSSLLILCMGLPSIIQYLRAKPMGKTMLLSLFSGICLLIVVYIFATERQCIEWSHSRSLIWRDTLPMLKMHPWIGLGIGGFAQHFPDFWSPLLGRHFYLFETIRDPHNAYLALLVEHGILGTLLGGFAWGSILWKSRKAGSDPSLHSASLLSLFFCALFMVSGEISNVFFATFFVWLSLALRLTSSQAAIQPSNSDKNHPQKAPIYASRIPLGSILLISLIWFGIWANHVWKYYQYLTIISSSSKQTMLQDMQEFIRSNPHEADAYAWIGNKYYQQGDYPKAFQAFQTAARLKPYLTQIQYHCGLAALAMHHDQEALFYFQQWTRMQGFHPEGLFALAKAQYKTKAYQECLQTLSMLNWLNPIYPHLRDLQILAQHRLRSMK